MGSRMRMVIIAMGGAFTLQGIAWLVVPERAAGSLGMPLLTGLARSTQIGDFAAFFLVLGPSILVGIGPGRARVHYVPAALLGIAAASRIFAWAVHGAAFAAAFIAIEIVASVLLLRSAARVER